MARTQPMAHEDAANLWKTITNLAEVAASVEGTGSCAEFLNAAETEAPTEAERKMADAFAALTGWRPQRIAGGLDPWELQQVQPTPDPLHAHRIFHESQHTLSGFAQDSPR